MRELGDRRATFREEGSDPRIRTSFAVAVAFAVTFPVGVLLSRCDASTRSGLVVLSCIAALAGWLFTWGGAVVTAGLAWLMLNGFVSDRFGELRWHGRSDVTEALVLVAASVLVGTVRSLQIRYRRRADLIQFQQEVFDLTSAARQTLGGRRA